MTCKVNSMRTGSGCEVVALGNYGTNDGVRLFRISDMNIIHIGEDREDIYEVRVNGRLHQMLAVLAPVDLTPPISIPDESIIHLTRFLSYSPSSQPDTPLIGIACSEQELRDMIMAA